MNYRRIKKSRVNNRCAKPKEGVWRFRIVQLGLYLFCIIVFLRLVQIQVLGHEKYSKLAHDQYVVQVLKKAKKGLILDRSHRPLALNRQAFDLGIDKRMVKNIGVVSRRISEVLQIPTADLLAKIRKGKQFVLAARQISLEDAEKIRAMQLQGVKLIESPQRVYPLNEELAQVLGFVDTDGKGLSGLELQFDDILKGKDGWRIVQKDATGKNILSVDLSPEAQHDGNDLILTIDSVIQSIAEEELSGAVSKYNAKGGTVIITRPHTGEILAMASQPGFNANFPGTTTADRWRNRAITDIYEPGSTFKVVTMMAALSEGIKNLDDIVFCENGKYNLFGETINDPESHGWLSFRNVFKYSSNIGTAKIALELGKENLFKAARSLGFGNKSGIELPGEVSGILRKPSKWSRFSLAAISYGHEIAVTPLQMAMAFGAIANGGQLMKPAIVKGIKSKSNETIYEFRPQSIRRVMTSAVAQTVTEVLQDVVTEGTGELARIPNGSVAGKTGTAQKLDSRHDRYSNSRFVASFAGFYPAEHPDYLIFLCIDEPFPTHSGGKVAAPTFRKILERILGVYQEIPFRNRKDTRILTTSSSKMIPNLSGRRLETVVKILQNLGIKYTTRGNGNVVIKQEVTTENSGELKAITLVLSEFDNRPEYAVMPNLAGLSMRRAISELSLRGLSAKVFGSGVVERQVPKAGEKIKTGARCLLEFRHKNQFSLLKD